MTGDGSHPRRARSIPISDDRRGGVLSVGSSFYEFVPAEDLEADPDGRTRWRFRSADELENRRRVLRVPDHDRRPLPVRHQRRDRGRGKTQRHAGDRVPPEGPRGHEPDRREGELHPGRARLRGGHARPRDPDRPLQGGGRRRRQSLRLPSGGARRDPGGRARRISARARRRARPTQPRVLCEAQEQPSECTAAPRDAHRVVRPREEAAHRRRPAPVSGEDGRPLAGDSRGARGRRRHRVAGGRRRRRRVDGRLRPPRRLNPVDARRRSPEWARDSWDRGSLGAAASRTA